MRSLVKISNDALFYSYDFNFNNFIVIWEGVRSLPLIDTGMLFNKYSNCTAFHNLFERCLNILYKGLEGVYGSFVMIFSVMKFDGDKD